MVAGRVLSRSLAKTMPLSPMAGALGPALGRQYAASGDLRGPSLLGSKAQVRLGGAGRTSKEGPSDRHRS